MLVSIIVPIFNSEKFLKEMINSLVEQSYKDIEIVLVNDGSTDNSLEICKEFEKKDKRIKVYSKTNGGVSSARNYGLQNSSGDFITFVDSDDIVSPKYIETLINNFEEDTLVKVDYRSQSNQITFDKDEFALKVLYGYFSGVCWGYLYEKEIIDNLIFDTNTSYMEDTIFLFEYLMRIKKIKCINENLYTKRENETSLTMSVKNIEKKIDGYIYSVNRLKDLTVINNIKFNQDIVNNRKIKIIEAEFGKVFEKDLIRTLLKNKNVLEIKEFKLVKKQYKIFISVLRTNNINFIFLYIKIRRFVKKIMKRK